MSLDILLNKHMGLIKFKHNDRTVAIVRNHKCSTTTMLSYVAQALWNADPKEEQFYQNFQNEAPGVYNKARSFEEFESELLDADIRIALWRDPVDKFVSGFYHTMTNPANKNLWIKSPSLTNFLKDIDVYRQNPNVADHCETNTARLGPARAIYTHIYNYKHVHKIAGILGVPALDTHHRRDNTMRAGPTDLQQLRIRAIMLEDYSNGWC
jgi:hypothetical protein